MYSEIIIQKTEIENKFLFIYRDKQFYGSFLLKEIIEMLKNNISIIDISSNLKINFDIDISPNDLTKVIEEKINQPIIEKRNKSKLFRIFKIYLSENSFKTSALNWLFKTKTFFLVLTSLFLINSYVFIDNIHLYTLSSLEKVYGVLILLTILVLHEIGHILSLKYYQTKVEEVGFGFYFILPVFYVNMNNAWALDKIKRIVVNFSGIFFQLVSGLILFIILYFQQSKNNLVIYLFNVNFSIILINLIPFFKFDGYWILSDLINVPNLNKKAFQYIFNFKKDLKFEKSVRIFAYFKLLVIFYTLSVLIKNIISYVS